MWEDNTSRPTNNKSKKAFLKKILMGGVGLAVIIVAIAAAFFFFEYQKAQNLLTTQTNVLDEQKAKKENESLVRIISKLAVLPTNETPTIATVSDKTKLAGQLFFEKSENGDRVLIYPNNKVAVLYRPSVGKIINLANNISVSTPTPTAAGAAARLSPTVAGVSTAPSPSPTQFIPPATPTPLISNDSGLTNDPTVTPAVTP